MRDTQRDRKRIRPGTLVVLRPLFRYSAGRDAYVLRVAATVGRLGRQSQHPSTSNAAGGAVSAVRGAPQGVHRAG